MYTNVNVNSNLSLISNITFRISHNTIISRILNHDIIEVLILRKDLSYIALSRVRTFTIIRAVRVPDSPQESEITCSSERCLHFPCAEFGSENGVVIRAIADLEVAVRVVITLNPNFTEMRIATLTKGLRVGDHYFDTGQKLP